MSKKAQEVCQIEGRSEGEEGRKDRKEIRSTEMYSKISMRRIIFRNL